MNEPDGSVAILNFHARTRLAHAMVDGKPICSKGRWLGASLSVCGPVTCGACIKALAFAQRIFRTARTCNELA